MTLKVIQEMDDTFWLYKESLVVADLVVSQKHNTAKKTISSNSKPVVVDQRYVMRAERAKRLDPLISELEEKDKAETERIAFEGPGLDAERYD